VSGAVARDRSLVRASDLGQWAFCRRAWWLAQIQGIPHQFPERLVHGTARHARHGVRARQAYWAERAGRWLLLAGLACALLLLAAHWLL
jgi:hypothetical protein